MRQYPLVKARCDVHSRARALAMLEQGTVHVALSSSLDEFDQNIEFRKFMSDPVVLIAPVDHAWAQRGEIEPAELLEARFIFREETAGTYRVTRTGLAGVGINISDLQTTLSVGNSEAIAIAVQRGIGVGFVSGMVVEHMAVGRVALVRVRGLSMQQDIFICRHRFHPFGSLQTAFWDFAGQSVDRYAPGLG